MKKLFCLILTFALLLTSAAAFAEAQPETDGGRPDFTAQLQHFVDCCLGNCECISPAEDGVVLMKILDAIYESAKTGHEVIIK